MGLERFLVFLEKTQKVRLKQLVFEGLRRPGTGDSNQPKNSNPYGHLVESTAPMCLILNK